MRIRILTSLAAVIVLAAMLYLVFCGPGLDSWSAEIVTPAVVLCATLLLGLLTYEPAVMLQELKKLFSRHRDQRRTMRRRFHAQMALYALVSGITLAIMQVLSSRTFGNQTVEVEMALWPLLYGVFLAIAFWIVAGIDGVERTPDTAETQRPSEDNHQIILAFCVLLLMVGVVSILFVEIYNTAPWTNKLIVREENPVVEPYGDLQLCDDLEYRVQAKSGVTAKPTDLPPAPPEIVQIDMSKAPAPWQESPSEPLLNAPLRWEPYLSEARSAGSTSDPLYVPAVKSVTGGPAAQ